VIGVGSGMRSEGEGKMSSGSGWGGAGARWSETVMRYVVEMWACVCARVWCVRCVHVMCG
jgi:hypothetical protein